MEFGLAFRAHQAHSYLLVVVGRLLLVRVLFRQRRVFRVQSTALLCAITIPMVGSVLSLFGAIPDGIDLAAPGYVVAGVILAGAAFRTDLLSLTPTVRELGREGVLPELDVAASELRGGPARRRRPGHRSPGTPRHRRGP